MTRAAVNLERVSDREGAGWVEHARGVEFSSLGHRGLRTAGQLRARPKRRYPTTEFDYVDLDWARRWPAEEVWKARRVAL